MSTDCSGRWALISGCETGPDPQPKSRRAVGSRGPERARSGSDHLAQQALAGCGAVGAASGGNLTFAPWQRSKHRRKSLWRLGAAAAARRRVKRAGLAPAWGGADVPKALRGDFHSLVATTANAREAGSRTLFTEPKIALRQKSSRRTFSQIEIGSIDRFSDRVDRGACHWVARLAALSCRHRRDTGAAARAARGRFGTRRRLPNAHLQPSGPGLVWSRGGERLASSPHCDRP